MAAPTDLLPTFPAVQSYRLLQETDKSTSLSGKIYAREKGVLRFEVTLQALPMTPARYAPIAGFLARHVGPANPFHIKIQQPLSGDIVQTGNFVNWSASPQGKLYQVTSVDPVAVHPQPPSGTPFTVDQAAYLFCAMKGSVQQVQDDRTGLVSFSLTVEEHLL